MKQLRFFFFLLTVIPFLGCLTGSSGSLSSVPTHIYQGVYSRDIGEFVDCQSQTVMLLSDSSQTLLDELRKAQLETTPMVFVEMNAIALTPDSAHIATPYDSVLVIYKVRAIKALDAANTCIAPPDKKCVVVKEFGLDHIMFTQSGVLGDSEDALLKKFPGFELSQNDSEYGEMNYEFRRGGGSVMFNLDSLNVIQEVIFSHLSSTDQFGVQIGTTSEQLKTIRPTLKAITNEDGGVLFGCAGSHIFYQPSGETSSNENQPTAPTTFRVNAIIWQRKACK